jgi:uncharacterized protein (TIGR00369 family)
VQVEVHVQYDVDDEALGHPELCSRCSPRQGAPRTHYRRTGPDSIVCEIRFEEHHQGWPGVAHGGQVAPVLDDACGYLSTCLGESIVTARIVIDFRRPAPLGSSLRVVGRVLGRTATKFEFHVDLWDRDQLIAEPTSVSVPVNAEKWNPWLPVSPNARSDGRA